MHAPLVAGCLCGDLSGACCSTPGPPPSPCGAGHYAKLHSVLRRVSGAEVPAHLLQPLPAALQQPAPSAGRRRGLLLQDVSPNNILLRSESEGGCALLLSDPSRAELIDDLQRRPDRWVLGTRAVSALQRLPLPAAAPASSNSQQTRASPTLAIKCAAPPIPPCRPRFITATWLWGSQAAQQALFDEGADCFGLNMSFLEVGPAVWMHAAGAALCAARRAATNCCSAAPGLRSCGPWQKARRCRCTTWSLR